MSIGKRWSSTIRRTVVVAVGATALLATVLVNPVSAHGSVVDPAARAYGCYERWYGNHQSPQMATEDPMCHQAWQANPNAMWNWNGLFREGVAGNHQGVIPDGQLCSGGRTQGGTYNAMDAVGAWRAQAVANNFTLRLHDPSRHGADYLRVYITRQGFNPLTQPLGWGNLELVATSPRLAPATDLTVAVNAGSRTGRHIVYTVWQASHLDQSYYFCSDVTFGGGTTPTTGATTPPTTRPTTGATTPPTTAATTPPTTSTGNPTGGCSATYRVTSQWGGGFQADVRVTAGAAGTNGWTVNWTFPSGERISSLWGATVAGDGTTVAARNLNYNGRLAANASTSFGFIGSGTAGTPTVTCTAS